MNLKDILKKVAEGKELAADEKAFLESYDPDTADGRIPKARLDQEIAKFKAEKDRADKLDSELADMREKLEELENSGKSAEEKAKAAAEKELAKLQRQVEALSKERDEAKANFEKSERTAKIAALAQKHSFSNAEYLDFLAASKKLDLNDEAAASDFMKELGKTSPELFKSAAKPGGGTIPAGKDSSGAKQRIDELMKKPELSTRESAEIIKLQQQIVEADSGKDATQNAKQGE